jgi:hypothetical protein
MDEVVDGLSNNVPSILVSLRPTLTPHLPETNTRLPTSSTPKFASPATWPCPSRSEANRRGRGTSDADLFQTIVVTKTRDGL